jgi:hypothetical protein
MESTIFDTINQLQAAVDPARFNTRSARRESRKFLDKTLGMCGFRRRDYKVLQVLAVEYPTDDMFWALNRVDHIRLQLAGLEIDAVVSWAKRNAPVGLGGDWKLALNYQGITCSVVVPAHAEPFEGFAVDGNLWRPRREQTIQDLQGFLAQIACLVVND